MWMNCLVQAKKPRCYRIWGAVIKNKSKNKSLKSMRCCKLHVRWEADAPPKAASIGVVGYFQLSICHLAYFQKIFSFEKHACAKRLSAKEIV